MTKNMASGDVKVLLDRLQLKILRNKNLISEQKLGPSKYL
jgi:hypothetical protein